MPELHFSIEIYQPPEAVFALIADLANYGRWLAPSTTYAETVEISENPVRAGTTYRDVNTSNAMRGLVQECTPYSLIVFHQETEKPGLAITARYELAPMEGGMRLERTTILTTAGLLRLAQPVVVARTRAENARALQAMKAYLERNKTG